MRTIGSLDLGHNVAGILSTERGKQWVRDTNERHGRNRQPAGFDRTVLNAILGQSRGLMGAYMGNPFGNPFAGAANGHFGGGFPGRGGRVLTKGGVGNLENDFGFSIGPRRGPGGLPGSFMSDMTMAPRGEGSYDPSAFSGVGWRPPMAARGMTPMTAAPGMFGGGGSYTAPTMRIPGVTGLPSFGAGRTAGNLGVGAAGVLGGMAGAALPFTTAGFSAGLAGLGAWAGPLGALAGAGLAIGLDKEGYYASGGLHDAIDNTLGRIPLVGGLIDFGTDAVQGVLDFVGLGGLFGGNREAKAAREAYQKERRITWKHLQIANNRRWTNFGIDTGKVRRDQGIQDWFLNSQQGLDWQRWNEEDTINDQSFIRNLAFGNQSFDLGRWRYNTLGQLGDQKAWTDTNMANNFANAALSQNISTMLQRAGLEANTAVIANAISTNLINKVGAIQDATSDKKGALAKFAYEENQRIEDDLYAASVQLDKTGAKRDMARVLDGWNTKTKMENRANEKLFRGDQIQEQQFQNRVAQQQHKAKLLMSGAGARGPASKADPIRASRISALAKINGAQSMAAERMSKLAKIGETMDYVRDSVQQDPENWNQSKKQLQFLLDALDDI